MAPVIRAWAGLPPEAERAIPARVPVRVVSELGRKEFVLVSIIDGGDATFAFPIGKGSGAVTSFSQADGFIEIDALSATLDADSEAHVTLLDSGKPALDLVIMARLGADQHSYRGRAISNGARDGLQSDLRDLVDLDGQHVRRQAVAVPGERVDQRAAVFGIMKPQNLLTGLPVQHLEAVS